MFVNTKITGSTPTEESKPKKRSKTPIYIICIILSASFIGIVIWAIISSLIEPPLDEKFFVSNAKKTTITLTPTDSDSGSNPNRQTYVVYDYDGESVVGMKTYFEYKDAESASIAYETLQNQPEFKNAELVDKFIIVAADPSQFEGLTASDIRQQAAAIEAYQAQQRGEESPSVEEEQSKQQESLNSGSDGPDAGK